MSDVALLGRQVGYEQRSYWRNPAAAGFSFVFPILLLLIFASTGSSSKITEPRQPADQLRPVLHPGHRGLRGDGRVLHQPGHQHDLQAGKGVLKRVRGTPLPPWAYLGGVIGNSVIVSIILAALVTAMGIIFYSVTLPATTCWR